MDASATPTTQAAAPLVIEELVRVFPGDRGLRGVSLSVGPGSIYALLGPNGAGKTSLIRAICGRLRPTSGRVAVLGHDPLARPATRRALGLVPQQLALYGELTVRENLRVFGRLAGIAKADIADRIAWGLDWAELEARAEDRVDTLSGGMRRRLHLVVGVLHEPKLLLLDEPTVGVDPDARMRLHDLLARLRDEGMALLLTTHDLDEAAYLSDRIGLLVDGRLRAEGRLEGLIATTYGEDRHLELLLAEAPDEGARKLLAARGLDVTRDPKRWLGRHQGAYEVLDTIEAELRAEGLGVRELQLREPGLREVFLQTTGEEFVS